MDILSYVDFEKMCMVIKYFPWLNQKIGEEDIILPISSSSRSTEWQKSYLSGF